MIDHRAGRSEHETPVNWLLSPIFPSVATCACVIAAGIALLAGGGGGLYWLVPAVVIAILTGLLNGWVPLVEILR